MECSNSFALTVFDLNQIGYQFIVYIVCFTLHFDLLMPKVTAFQFVFSGTNLHSHLLNNIPAKLVEFQQFNPMLPLIFSGKMGKMLVDLLQTAGPGHLVKCSPRNPLFCL